jgi:hypothetical protein
MNRTGVACRLANPEGYAFRAVRRFREMTSTGFGVRAF